jgi:hypothetical protein
MGIEFLQFILGSHADLGVEYLRFQSNVPERLVLDTLEARPLPITDIAGGYMIWSPDSRSASPESGRKSPCWIWGRLARAGGSPSACPGNLRRPRTPQSFT